MVASKGMQVGAAVLMMAVLGAGCAGPADEAGRGGASAPPPDRIPGCGRVAAAMGPLVADLLPAEDHEERFDTERMYGVSCSWVTPEAASENAFEVFQMGALAVRIDVDRLREPIQRSAVQSMGMLHEDPRADAADAFITATGAPLDLGAPLGIAGIQVTRGRLTVGINAGGVMLSQADGLRHVTNDEAIAAAVALIQTIE